MKSAAFSLLFFILPACTTVPGREVPLQTIAVRRATTLFTGKTACNTVKLYKIKRVHATQSERVYFFRLGGCNTAMDFMVQCVKWSHTCPEGRMLLFMKGKPGINMEPLFNRLPLTTKQQ